MSAPTEWLFANFRYDVGNSRLTRDGEVIALRPKTFALLDYLLLHHGSLVDKNQLLDAVWGHRHVSESVLEVCVSELRRALGDDSKAPRFLETVARKGYRFVAEVSQPAPTQTFNPENAPLAHVPPPEAGNWVGRATFLQQLQDAWKSAQSGVRRFVMLTAEAGMGKTTLLEMFLQSAAPDKPIVFWCQCIEHFGAGEAFLPLLGALQNCPPALIPVMQALAPTWLVQLPGLLNADARADLKKEVLGATRERMLREGCEMLEAFSTHAPLIVVLEDLHWSDYATLELLSALGRRRSGAALLVVGSYRGSEVAASDHPLRRMHQELQMHRLCTELALTAFSTAELGDYLARRFPQSRFPDDIATIVYRRSGGQPLFLINLIDYLLAEDILRQDGECWSVSGGSDKLEKAVPDDIRLMIEHRLSRLGEQEQKLLEAASVGGAICSAALLAAVLKQDLLEVELCCERLARSGPILEASGVEEWPDGTLSGNYAFRHALYGEVLYQRLSPAYRSILHQRIGECLETVYRQSSNDIAAELARHFEEGRNFAKAAHYLCLAGAKAAQRFANRETLGYLQRALQLAPRLPETQRDEQQFALLQWMANIHCSMYDMPKAIADLHELLQAARAAGDKRWEIRALLGLSRMYYLTDPRLCILWVDEAFAQSSALSDASEKALVRGYRAHWHLAYVEWRDEYRQDCNDALAAAYESGDPHTISRHLVAVSVCELYASDYQAAIVSTSAGMDAAERGGDGYLYLVCLALRCYALLLSGNWGALRELVDTGLAAAEKNGNPMTIRRLRLDILVLLVDVGDYRAARQLGEQIAQMGVAGDDFSNHMCQLQLAKAYLKLKDRERALECLQNVDRLLAGDGAMMNGLGTPWYLWIYSDYGLAAGDLQLAGDKAREMLAAVLPRRDTTFIALARRQLAEIALAKQDLQEAERQLAAVLSIVSENTPFASRRVYQTAQELYTRKDEHARAEEYRRKIDGELSRLAGSLKENDPLRQTILRSPAFANEPVSVAAP